MKNDFKKFLERCSYEDLIEFRSLIEANIKARFEIESDNDILESICKEFISSKMRKDKE